MTLDADGFPRSRSPESAKHALGGQPQLATWYRADHPSRRALREFLNVFEATVERNGYPAGPVAIQLNVALEPGVPLLCSPDLDNHLTPIMSRMRQRKILSVWGTK